MTNWTAFTLVAAVVLWALVGYATAARDAAAEPPPVILIVDYGALVEDG